MPISSDTIYNSNFNGKTNFSKDDLFCKIFTKYAYINSLLMLYNEFMLFLGSWKMDPNCIDIGPYSPSAS